MPVVTPSAASMETVKAVPWGLLLLRAIWLRPSCWQRASVRVRQMSPRPYLAMKLMASAVTCSAAITRSPSFSRSSSSTRMTILPARMSATISRTEDRDDVMGSGGAHHALDIARDEVDFEIDRLARSEQAQGGDLHRVRNEVDGEVALLDAIHRQAYAIDRDRPLARDVFGQRRGGADHQLVALARRGEAQHFADAVHVAGHEVAAEPVRQA